MFKSSYSLWVTPHVSVNRKILRSYIIVVSFHLWLSSYKFSNIFIPIQHPWNGLFWKVFEPFLPQIRLDFTEIFSRSISSLDKHSVWRLIQNIQFLKKRNTQKLTWFIFGPYIPPENQEYCQKPIFLQKLHLSDYKIALLLGSTKITKF